MLEIRAAVEELAEAPDGQLLPQPVAGRPGKGRVPARVVLAATGRFSAFDMARELHRLGYLRKIFTGYPRFRLRRENLPQSLIHTYPWIHAPYMAFAFRGLLGSRINRFWEIQDQVLLSRHVARHLQDGDLLWAYSGSGLEAGRVARQRGGRHVCHRGSTHIVAQDQIMREEHEHWGLPHVSIDQRVIEREAEEYDQADLITVPSAFSLRSFIDQGVSPLKLRCLPYGVNLARFHRTTRPRTDGFDVLFVGGLNPRKGLPYLLEAFGRIQHPGKTLTLIGYGDPGYVQWLKRRRLLTDDVRLVGHMPQHRLKDAMSSSHVMVLPSVEEGLAAVQGQALACGCPVIATENTGAEDLFSHGEGGFILPARDVDALAGRMQALADDRELQAAMSAAALKQVRNLNGWSHFGNRAELLLQELCPG